MAGESLHKWFSRKRPYPACRPTKAQCTSAAKKKTSSKRISWKKKKKRAA